MIVSINQPAYLPWLGYFDRIDASDFHIVLDHVQFEKNSFVNRNKIRTPTGWMWLTVPVATSGRFGDLAINDLLVADGARWQRKHWAALEANYAKTPYFAMHRDFLSNTYDIAAPEDHFLPTVQALNAYFLETLGITTDMVTSTDLGPTEKKSNLILELCEGVGATSYLSGPLGRDYLDRSSFETAGIEILFHDYDPRPYEQAWPGFEPGMAIIDILACHRPEQAIECIRAGRRISHD